MIFFTKKQRNLNPSWYDEREEVHLFWPQTRTLLKLIDIIFHNNFSFLRAFSIGRFDPIVKYSILKYNWR